MQVDYTLNMTKFLTQHGKLPIVWQDVFNLYEDLPVYEKHFKYPIEKENFIIHLWRYGVLDLDVRVLQYVQAKHVVIASGTCWQLNSKQLWEDTYICDPFRFAFNKLHKYAIGGEAVTWGERVDSANFIITTWPKIAVPAEVLWSPKQWLDEHLRLRFRDNRCRLVRRNINARPEYKIDKTGRYCVQEYQHGYTPTS